MKKGPSNTNNNNTLISYNNTATALSNVGAVVVGYGIYRKITKKLVESVIKIGFFLVRSNFIRFKSNYLNASGSRVYGHFFLLTPINNINGIGGVEYLGIVNFYFSSLDSDPCASLFPVGAWRLPISAGFNLLDGGSGFTIGEVFGYNTAIEGSRGNVFFRNNI